MSESYDFGKLAEQRAVEYLQSKSYTILERNYRFGKAEIDIIAQSKGIICIVEVKARKSNYFGKPKDAVTSKKRNLLRQATDQYITTKNLDIEVRFDIISITQKGADLEISHIKNAFGIF